MAIKLLLYFLFGGTVVALISYLGSQARGLLAAFVATFPAISVVSVLTIYLGAGTGAATSYLRGMLMLVPAWLLYMFCLLYLLPRLGLVTAVSIMKLAH